MGHVRMFAPEGRLGRFLGETAPGFFAYVGRNFANDRCAFAAGHLSYTTLLALVPLLAVAFSVLAAFPVFGDLSREIQSFVLNNFVPAVGAVVQEHLEGFIGKASRLTAPGVVFLVITSVMLIASIDRTVNGIFRVRAHRSVARGFLVYWAALTLGPLLIGASVAISSYLISLPLLSDVPDLGLKRRVLGLLPFISATAAFAFIYSVLPTRRVPWRAALAGGAVAALLFELAKRGFGFYVTQFPTYEAIYGALAAIPIFLVWVYVCWLVILLGAEFTFGLMSFRRARAGGTIRSDFRLALRVLGHFYRAHLAGRGLGVDELLGREPDVAGFRLWPALDRLQSAGYIMEVREGHWVLTRGLQDQTLHSVFEALDLPLPPLDGYPPECDLWDARAREVFADIHARMPDSMGLPLVELFDHDVTTSDRKGACL
ncbi:MAG: virulence factor BrkB family protein [Gammaproteobacteria bacterium]